MTKIIKEHTHTGAIEPGSAKGEEHQYISNNVNAYQLDQEDKLMNIQKAHLDHHNKALGFNHFNPTEIRTGRNHHLKANTVIQETTTARTRVKAKLDELGGNVGYEGISDPPPKGRTNDQLEEGPLKDKAKKVAMAGMTAANMYTMADAISQHHPHPQSDMVRAATALPGAAGWAASAAHYGKKGYDLAKDVLKKKKATMEEEKKMSNPCWKGYKAYGMKKKNGKEVPNCVPVEEDIDESAAWQRSAGKDPKGGLNRKGIASYRREHPGSKLSMAVTTKPSKLDPDSKPAKRRKSFCARMGGMKGPMKDEKGRPTRKALALRKWNCEEQRGDRPAQYSDAAERGIYEKAPPGDKFERMVKHIKAGYAKDGKLTKKEKGIAFATAWKAKNKAKLNELDLGQVVRKGADMIAPGITGAYDAAKQGNYADAAEKAATAGVAFAAKRAAPVASGVLGSTSAAAAEMTPDMKDKLTSMKASGLSTGPKPMNELRNKIRRLKEEAEAPDMNKVLAAFRRKESGSYEGNYGAKSKSSSASGAYQFTNKTWRSAAASAGYGGQYKSAGSAPKEVQDKVMTHYIKPHIDKYGLQGAVNVHYTGNSQGRISGAGLKANRGQGAGKYFADFQKHMAGYSDSSSKPTQTASADTTPKADNTPKPTQVATATKVNTPSTQQATPKPTQVATATQPTQTSSSDVSSSSSYNVQKGDTLGALAKKYNVDTASLAKSSGISNPNKIAVGQKINIPQQPKPTQMASLQELKHETLGSYIGKASKSRKKSLESSKADIKTWGKRQKGITTAIKKLTKENSKDKDFDDAVGFMGKGDVAEQQSHLHLNKPDTRYAPGASGTTHTIHEETKMENQNLVNEAIENILENDLVAMKENLMVALQEKAQEKLEERKKEIAANYFAQ